MVKVLINDQDSEVYVADNQEWDKATIEQLWAEHNIIFRSTGTGVIAVKVIERNRSSPLLALGFEDDGVISFGKMKGQYTESFSSYWAKSLIADLEAAIGTIKERCPYCMKLEEKPFTREEVLSGEAYKNRIKDFYPWKTLADEVYTSLEIGFDDERRVVMSAFSDDAKADYYPKFCPECGRVLREENDNENNKEDCCSE